MEDELVQAAIEAKYQRYVSRTIYKLRRFPSYDYHGEDSKVRTLWDLWKYELQEDHSALHHLIEQTVEAVVWNVLGNVPRDDGLLLTAGAWHHVDDDDECDQESPPSLRFNREAVFAELLDRLNTQAVNEPHRREVQEQLDDEAMDRFERDNWR